MFATGNLIKTVCVPAGVVLCVALLSSALPAESQAAVVPQVAVTYTACGNGVDAVNVAPRGNFDPTTLTDTQLTDIGYPPRPSDPSMLSTWQRFVRNGLPHTPCTLRAGRRHLPPQLTAEGGLGAATTGSASLNWAGNIANGHPYSNAQAYWKVPLGSANPGDQAYSSSWVGIGQGKSSALPLIQAGTESDTVLGTHTFYLWWEVYPEVGSQTITASTTAGDTIYTKITAGTNTATFQVLDETKGTGGTYHYSGHFGVDGTAEWILERPWVGFFPHLANATTTFTTAAASAPGVALTGVGKLPHDYDDMFTCDGKTLMAIPGAISSDGFSFTDYWQAYGDVISSCG